MRSILIVLLVLAAIVAGATLVWFESEGTAPPLAPGASPRATTMVSAPRTNAVADVDNAVVRDDARVAAAVPAPKPVQGIEDAGAAPVGLDFTGKYEHDTREQLTLKLSELDARVEKESDALFRARFERNQFQTYKIEPNDARPLDEITETLKSPAGLCSTRAVATPSNGAGPAQARVTSVEIVCLARDEFPALYAVFDEREWLRNSLERLVHENK